VRNFKCCIACVCCALISLTLACSLPSRLLATRNETSSAKLTTARASSLALIALTALPLCSSLRCSRGGIKGGLIQEERQDAKMDR